MEEVVMSFQGIISKMDLPPFQEKLRYFWRCARFLRQSITVTGLKSPTFAKVVENVAEVHALFSRTVGQNQLQECSMIAEDGDDPVLEMSNRYFTPKKDAPQMPSIPLTADIDPHGYLARAGGQSHIHGEDNVVYYYERQKAQDTGDHKFVPCKPVRFRIGDIVEVQVSFALLPLRDGKCKTSMVLRTLTLLDGSLTHKSLVEQVTRRGGPSKAEPKLKRRVGYVDEEISKTRMKLNAMNIDDKEEGASAEENAEAKSLD
ncbi:hypothetical protein BDZ97DRAFT_2047168 [Flammula alnicola]|nr:hypothetical protein BDZ97DRAFT_2047168 [Flammula alnicola]